MPLLIAVDPGKHKFGQAHYRNALLCWAEHTPTGPIQGVLHEQVKCVCEIPQVYDKPVKIRGRAVRINPRDLIDLAVAAGRITALLPTKYVLPAQWKHQVPKEIQHARMWKVLAPTGEDAILKNCVAGVAESLRHNVYDAVCIGLVELGRMGLGGG